MALRILDLVFLGRPLLIIPVWTVYLHFLAFILGTGYWQLKPEPGNIISLIFLTLVFKGTYVINQIFDIESDRKNDKLYFLPKGIITLKTAWVFYALLSSAGLALALIWRLEAAVLTAIIIVLGISYSLPKVGLKDRPVTGLLANAFAFGLLVPVTAIIDSHNSDLAGKTIPYFLAIATGYIMTTIPDINGDAVAGKKTVAVILGPKAALWLALLTAMATEVASVMTGNYEMAGVALVTLMLIIVPVISFNERMLNLACKFPILLLTLLAGLHYPAYIVILLLTIALTRFYYKKRFDMVYPRLI